jgi:hypothetical protein
MFNLSLKKIRNLLNWATEPSDIYSKKRVRSVIRGYREMNISSNSKFALNLVEEISLEKIPFENFFSKYIFQCGK